MYVPPPHPQTTNVWFDKTVYVLQGTRHVLMCKWRQPSMVLLSKHSSLAYAALPVVHFEIILAHIVEII